MIVGVDAPAWKHVRACHEGGSVVAPDEQYLESRPCR
jgi:hypothetical protein